jgi:hypothetical protein
MLAYFNVELYTAINCFTVQAPGIFSYLKTYFLKVFFAIFSSWYDAQTSDLS